MSAKTRVLNLDHVLDQHGISIATAADAVGFNWRTVNKMAQAEPVKYATAEKFMALMQQHFTEVDFDGVQIKTTSGSPVIQASDLPVEDDIHRIEQRLEAAFELLVQLGDAVYHNKAKFAPDTFNQVSRLADRIQSEVKLITDKIG